MGSGSTHSAQAINKKEITKINKCIKDNNAEPFFKCLKCSILSAKTFGIDIMQFIRQPTKSVPCQSQTENHISHPSITTDQSKQIHSSSDQLSVASADQNSNRPSPQVTLVTQKTHLRPDRYQTQTVCQRASKTPSQAKIFD